MLEIAIQSPTHAAEDPTGSADVRAERAAARAALRPEEVERLPFDLSALDEDGVFVNVDARGFGLLDRRLDWQALGITLPRGSDLAFRPPRCGLLPDRYRLPLVRPAGQAHAALHRYSYHFRLTETVFETPAYRWIPWRAFDAFERAFGAAQAALDAARTTVLDHYAAVREETLDAFLRLAADSARRLEATGHTAPLGFEETVVRGVVTAMPSPEDLCTRLTLRYRVGVIMLGSEMLEEQRKSRDERQKLDAVEAEIALERRREEARGRLVQEAFFAEEERLRRRLRAEEEERGREAAVKERLRQLKLDAAKERLQEAMSPLEEGAKQLHAAVYDAAVAIRMSLRKHSGLHGASAKKARELARWFRLMSWRSDGELEALLVELETLAARTSGTKRPDPGALDGVLGDIVARCYADARALAEPHRMAALEL